MKMILSMLALAVAVLNVQADNQAKFKARAKAALALAAAGEDVKPLKEAPKPSVLTDLEEAKRQAARENKPLVVWVAADPMDLDTAVHVRVDEHAGICGNKAAIIYSVGGGRVSDNGRVEYDPKRETVSDRIRENTPPPPKPMPKPANSDTTQPVTAPAPSVSVSQFIVAAPPVPQPLEIICTTAS